MWTRVINGQLAGRPRRVVVEDKAWRWEDIEALADQGQTDFGTFQVQETEEPYEVLNAAQWRTLVYSLPSATKATIKDTISAGLAEGSSNEVYFAATYLTQGGPMDLEDVIEALSTLGLTLTSAQITSLKSRWRTVIQLRLKGEM